MIFPFFWLSKISQQGLIGTHKNDLFQPCLNHLSSKEQLYERARDAFQRCLAPCSSIRQDQPRIPVKGLTSRTLLQECKGVLESSLPHSLRAYQDSFREKWTAQERTKLLRRFSMVRYWILRRKSLLVQFEMVSWLRPRKGKIKQVKCITLAQVEHSTQKLSISKIMVDARNERFCTLRGVGERQSGYQPDMPILPSDDATKTSTMRIGPSCNSLFPNSEKSPNETCPTHRTIYTQNMQVLNGKDKRLDSLVDPLVGLMITNNIMVYCIQET